MKITMTGTKSIYYGPALIISAVFIIALLAARNIGGVEWMSHDNDVLVNYLQVISAIYAIIVGFVLYVVWGQFVEMEKLVGREAGLLQATRRLSALIGDDEEQAVRWAVTKYIEINISRGDIDVVWKNLHLTISNIGRNRLNEIQQLIFTDMLDKLEQVIECRNERAALDSSRIPWPLWWILGIVTSSLLIPFCLLSVQSLPVHILLVESSVISSSFILSLIADLDHPVYGAFNVRFSEMEKLIPDTHLRIVAK